VGLATADCDAWACGRRVTSPARSRCNHKVGFSETGVRRPLPTNPALEIVELQCELLNNGLDATTR